MKRPQLILETTTGKIRLWGTEVTKTETNCNNHRLIPCEKKEYIFYPKTTRLVLKAVLKHNGIEIQVHGFYAYTAGDTLKVLTDFHAHTV